MGSFARADDLFATRRNDIVLSNYKEPCCFAAGTKVSTPNGDRTIESLKVGDVVWSKPEKGGKPFAAKILATHQRTDQPIYRLKLKSVRSDGKAQGETLLVTPGHPFYVPAKRDFISVIDLKPGDLLQSLADGDTDNTSSEVESLELYLPVGETYNLTVDVGHTFYVGDLKTWVHNTGPCALPEGYFEAKAADTAKVGFADGKIAGEASELLVKPAPVHHICTNKNCVSTARGGPWTPKFEAIFTRAGLDLDDAINKVAVPGHKGPHPQDYHAYIYDQLQSATVGVPANTSAYKNAIELTLERIKVEAVTPGSQVNRWLRKE